MHLKGSLDKRLAPSMANAGAGISFGEDTACFLSAGVLHAGIKHAPDTESIKSSLFI
jgi:hypothetical protein